MEALIQSRSEDLQMMFVSSPVTNTVGWKALHVQTRSSFHRRSS